MRRLPLLLAFTLTGCGLLWPDPAQQARYQRIRGLQGDAARGSELIAGHCLQCHVNGRASLPCSFDGEIAASTMVFGFGSMKPRTELTDQQAADIAAAFDECPDAGLPDAGLPDAGADAGP